MVLWELTLATAYVSGLQRTYRLVLRLQRRLIGPNHPKICDFAYRRMKDVFTMALNVQEGSKSGGGECSKDPTKTSLNASTSTAKSKPVNALYRAGLGGQHGHSIGSGLSSGLSRLAPQTSRQSLPLVMGLWWQPVRKNMEFLGERVSSPQLRLLELGSKGSIASSHGLELGRGVFWADIATWMQKPHHIRGSFGQPTFALLAHANCC
ncbi:unnamed protein product [Sphagnum jensenii]|uniref:Uncharacterized protein n=1 Tax=Sphagnum jensenii TaxID=128206 RepID=A0ABP0XCF5_9BRYO